MSSPDAPATGAPTVSEVSQSPVRFGFENTYARLPERFYARVDPTPVAAPGLIKVNVELALHLGLDPDAPSQARKASRSSPATVSPRGPSLWHKPMPDTSSAISCHNSAMAAPTCSAKS